MSRMPQRCGPCGGTMKSGLLRDLKNHHGESTSWVEGPVERSLFLGFRVRGRPQGEVHALRCDTCGRIELYVPTLTT